MLFLPAARTFKFKRCCSHHFLSSSIGLLMPYFYFHILNVGYKNPKEPNLTLCSEASPIWYSCRTNVKNGKILTTVFFRGEYSRTYSNYIQSSGQILSEISPKALFLTPRELLAALPVTSMRSRKWENQLCPLLNLPIMFFQLLHNPV